LVGGNSALGADPGGDTVDVLAIDLETYSPVDIKKTGVYPYAEHPDFEILLFGYAWNDDPVRVVDLAQGEQIPDDVRRTLLHHDILKTAYNAQFERVCLSRYLKLSDGYFLSPTSGKGEPSWSCTAVHALTLGLPGTLEQVAKVLNFPGDKQKMAEGKALINYFCKPCKPTKANGGRTRNLPHHAPEKWELFKQYCGQDVEVERSIRSFLSRFPVPKEEQRLYALDQRINDRGVRVDTSLVHHAIACDEQHKTRTLAEAVELTGLSNPNSGTQLKQWLFDEDCLNVTSLTKDSVPELLKQTESETVKRALELRQELAKTSVKKYQAMHMAICHDDRVRGLLQFYGANRTGRWAGRLVQVQNLPQNHLPDLDLARQLLRDGEYEMIEVLFGNVQNVLSQLIRTAFIPSAGHAFIVADFSAIEARVIAWLAGEKWRLEVFKTHGQIYEASASAMFKVPWSEFQTYIDQGKKHPLRQKGKIAELALGYQGSVGALITMGALKMGLIEEELPGLVAAWRKANPYIVQLWRNTEEAAVAAVRDKTSVNLVKGIQFRYEGGMLFARVPSGRCLAYVRPKLEESGQFNKLSITYEGMDQTTKQWTRVPTYGGKLVENLVQAIARDCLAVSMLRLDEAGYKTVMHVHDEAVIDAPDAGATEKACQIMGQPIQWAPGLPLRADGFTTAYYKKDD
jgi:DNA polymerase